MKKFKVSFIAKCFASIIAVIIVISSTNILIQNYFIQSIYIENKKEIHADEIDLLKSVLEATNIQELTESDDFIEFRNNVENALVIIDSNDSLEDLQDIEEKLTLLQQAKNDNYLEIIKNSLKNNDIKPSEFIENTQNPAIYITKDSVKNPEGLKIHIITLLTADEVQPIFLVLNKYYSIQFLLTIIIILFFGFIFTKKFQKPISLLKNNAKSIALADFEKITVDKRNDELGELHESLEQIAINLSSKIELINEKKNQEMKERKRITTLLANLSHEFKTPLGIISGFVEMIEDGIKPDNQEEYLTIINDEINILNTLVNESLELSKYESQTVILNITTFSLSELLTKVSKKFHNEMIQKNLTFQIDSPEVNIIGDRKRIGQVLTNIISNAIKHSYSDKIIKIHCNTSEEYIRINIENSGDLISNDDLPKLWDAYYRIETFRNRKTGGSGLGLSIVKNILDLHESEYGATNTLQGVIFYFTLKIST